MLENYFSKGFAILECNVNNLTKITNEVKQKMYAEETDNSDKFMICITQFPPHQTPLRSCC